MRDRYDLMFEKMCLEIDVWKNVNYPHNKEEREKDVLEKFK